MIFLKYTGKVYGIWNNGFDTWVKCDSTGVVYMGSQPEILQVQCDAMNHQIYLPGELTSCDAYAVKVAHDYDAA